MRWVLLAGMSAALATAVFQRGGVVPAEWSWVAAGVLILAILAHFAEGRADRVLEALCWALAGVVALQLAPLPESWVQAASPASAEVWRGAGRSGWMQLSVAPARTIEELLRLVATLAALLTARRLGYLWRDRMWVAALPVVAVAWLQSLLGLTQFWLARAPAGGAASPAGTYEIGRAHV